ncbi:flagellar biosynthetic protein FliR [Nitrosomonas halophila]|uniref:Flagellar biosynthetic protein FliR n=1 Tax=Nitrosomonas halophila TaxID=44576 RepID=A0A1H3JHA8_9PROT|nr:flagellar biosynthetic protein FliR [Nitrosomonas halophila]SDY38969.1 flagellar biosynthetic protein FliR [Nitrosomonas halophila]HRQ04881.1 flagellar biosynthetic protein FliR [Nitrosomonas halophila]
MLNITTAELNTWLATLLWPLTRILGLLASAPVLGNNAIPVQVKLGLAVLLTILVAPSLPPLPRIDPGSGIGLVILLQQVVIGLAMGFAMRIVFTAVEMAGEIIGLQMGLGFATFFDPQHSGQVQLIGRFFGLITTLAFLSIDGHLQIVALLVRSFSILPIGLEGVTALSFATLTNWGIEIFTLGLRLALPVLTALLITNLALGILTRAAPQLNIFAVGFPLTLGIGLVMMSLTLPYFAPVLRQIFLDGFSMAHTLIEP